MLTGSLAPSHLLAWAPIVAFAAYVVAFLTQAGGDLTGGAHAHVVYWSASAVALLAAVTPRPSPWT
jgi:hypothetical protein